MNRTPLNRTASGFGVSWRARGEEAGTPTVRWQDKRPHIARLSVGCFVWVFGRVSHRAAFPRNVRMRPKPLYLNDLSHLAEPRHGR